MFVTLSAQSSLKILNGSFSKYDINLLVTSSAGIDRQNHFLIDWCHLPVTICLWFHSYEQRPCRFLLTIRIQLYLWTMYFQIEFTSKISKQANDIACKWIKLFRQFKFYFLIIKEMDNVDRPSPPIYDCQSTDHFLSFARCIFSNI